MKKRNLLNKMLALAMSLCMIFTMLPMAAHATESEHEHDFAGSWTANADSHWYTCVGYINGIPCNEKGALAPHDWDSQYTITCFTCHYSQPHTHTGGTATCKYQATCELCGFYYGDYDHDNHQTPDGYGDPIDENTHRIICLGCDHVFVESEAHNFGDWSEDGDNQESRYCSDCLYTEYRTIETHTHDWGIRQRNETYHEEYCPGCGETGMQGMHTYGDDNICDGCGYTTHVHSWEIRQYNESHHEEYCPGCGETGMRGMHAYGDDGVCTVCGHTQHNHTWEYRIVNESRHEPYCPGCGETGLQGMHTYGNNGICTLCGHAQHNHSWEYRIINESRHEPYCPGCGETGLQGMHTWKYVPYGASTHQEVCTVCEYKGEKLLHENHNPDEDWLCDLCGANTCKHEERTPANCVSGEICKKCGYDDDSRDPEEHVGYTCDSPGICACGAATGNIANPYHTGGTEIRNAKEATRTEKGYTGDTHCKGCGKKLESGEEIPAKGFVAVKIADDADVLEVTFTTAEGVTLPDDAEVVVKDHTPSADDLDFVALEEAPALNVVEDLSDVPVVPQEFDDGTLYGPGGKEYTFYEKLIINGEEYYVDGADADGRLLLFDKKGDAYFYDGNSLGQTDIFEKPIVPDNEFIRINGVVYQIIAKWDGQYALWLDGKPVGAYNRLLEVFIYFDEEYAPDKVKERQQNSNQLGTVTLGESPVDGLVSGKTYNVSVIGSNDISVPGYDDALIDSIKIETEAKKAAKAEVERLKADMEAKKAALDQLDTTDPDHMFAWAAWHEAETAYKMALLALTDNQKATVTQTFEIPAEFVGNKNVKYVAYHGLVEGYELGKTFLSEDGKTLTATYEVDSFSPFIVYAFVEADEPEIKTLSATVVDGSDDTTEAPDTDEPVVSPQTSDSWIWYVLVAVVAGAIAVASVVYGKRRKSKAN